MSENSTNLSHLGYLDPNKTVFFLCDLQERFSLAILYFEEIVTVAKKLIQAGKLFNIPLIVTEQYPRGLGSTFQALDIKHANCIVHKTKFSMIVPEVEEMMKSLCAGSIENVVLFGLEAHICIEQTAIDLLAKSIRVHVIADATSSRSQEDRLLAFQRLRQMGCFVATSENIIFKLLRDKEHPKFNEVRALIKNTSPNTKLAEFM